MQFKPYLNQERLRLAIKHFEFNFNDYSLVLHRPEENGFDNVFEQFAGIYLEHMRSEVEKQLPAKLAVSL